MRSNGNMQEHIKHLLRNLYVLIVDVRLSGKGVDAHPFAANRVLLYTQMLMRDGGITPA